MALRDEQLLESQAERRRLRQALEGEEVEVQRLRGRSSELQEALAVEVQREEGQRLVEALAECRQLRREGERA